MQALGPVRVVGISESPDNVAFPLAAPRVYVSRAGPPKPRSGYEADPDVNSVELWVTRPRTPRRSAGRRHGTPATGSADLRFVTRAGVES